MEVSGGALIRIVTGFSATPSRWLIGTSFPPRILGAYPLLRCLSTSENLREGASPVHEVSFLLVILRYSYSRVKLQAWFKDCTEWEIISLWMPAVSSKQNPMMVCRESSVISQQIINSSNRRMYSSTVMEHWWSPSNCTRSCPYIRLGDIFIFFYFMPVLNRCLIHSLD